MLLPDQTNTTGPLKGLVVVDMTRILAGPYCTMLLADLGATVIKIESPSGDDTRQWKPPTWHEVSTYFMSVNRNKFSIALDLATDEGLDTAYKLLDRADVFVENFRTGSLAKFGLDPQSTSARWPGLIHASVTGFGSKGGAGLPGYDIMIQALSGLMDVTGPAETEPQKAGFAVFDVLTGLHTAVGVLAALRHKELSGQGQHLEVNLMSTAIASLVNQSSAAAAGGVTPRRMGNDHPSLVPYGPYEAFDRPLIIACGNNRQFTILMNVLGTPQLSEDSRFNTVEMRVRNRDELRALMETRLKTAPAQYWIEQLQNVGIPCALINSVSEGIEFAERLGLEPVVDLYSDGSSAPTLRSPIELSVTPVSYLMSPPALGEHQSLVRKWLSELDID